jgi:cytochrome P450
MSNDEPGSDRSIDLDIFDPDYTRDPAPVWRELQQKCPIAHTDHGGGMWIATKYDDAQTLVKKTSVLSNRQVSIAPMREDSDLLADYHSEMNPPITKDPPDHTPLRRLILPFFTPKAVEVYRPFTVKLCHQLIDAFVDKGACDAAADYAQQLTPRVIAHMLGIDTDRADEFVEWTRGLVEFGYDDIELRSRSMKQMQAFFREMVAERRQRPTGDYISQLLEKEVEGKPLEDKMVVNLCVLLLIAGIDTTWSSLGSSLLHFSSHEEDRRRMVVEPELFPSAIEELLRFYSPVSVGRIAMEDLDYNGVCVKRGERMMLSFPAANRDPDKFERADEVVLDRQKNRHIAFGIGVHRCAGSNLARMEMDVALRTWFERIPEFRLSDPDKVTWAPGQVRGARSVPVVF